MKYIMRACYSSPDGGQDGVNYWLAESESEMKMMLKVNDTMCYCFVTCLGPALKMPEWIANKMEALDTPEN